MLCVFVSISENLHSKCFIPYKKGGFVVNQHDKIKKFLTVCVNKVCHNVESGPCPILITTRRRGSIRYKERDNIFLIRITSFIWKVFEAENQRL